MIVKSSITRFIVFPLKVFVSFFQNKSPDKSGHNGMMRSCVGNVTNMANMSNNWTPTVGSVEGAG